MKHFVFTLSNIIKKNFYLFKCEFELISRENQQCQYVTSKILDKKTMISAKKVIIDFKTKGMTPIVLEEGMLKQLLIK